MKSCAFVTLGCKINQYETEAVREEVLALGFEEVAPESPADLYVVNTCSVTHSSGAQSRRAVLRLARTNPAARIVVMGCSSPREKDLLGRIPQVAVLVGNEEKGMVPGLIREGLPSAALRARPSAGSGPGPAGRLRAPRKDDPRITRDILDLKVGGFRGRTRAYLKVQDGCNGFCSFCIIPYLRGASRSRDGASVLEEARRLAGNGYREVVITGIHLQDYGGDLEPAASLAGLLAALASVARKEGLWRIRLSSLGPRAFTEDLVDILRDPLFCPHWHVPLQSGDDGVLKLMRRDYGREDFLAALALIEGKIDRPSITTDVIVGHPGESERAFESTLDLCERSGFSKIHIFPFSPREGTPSAKLPGKVSREEVARRERALRALERDLALRYRSLFLGETIEVLLEGAASGSPGAAEGYTERYLRFRAAAEDPDALRNTLRRAAVEKVRPDLLEGRLAGAVPEEAGDGPS